MFIISLLVSLFTFVELNCENLFDCHHDSLKNDVEFLPEGSYHWTRFRYWRKLNRVGQTIVACGENSFNDALSVNDSAAYSQWIMPDMVALCEVENDSVMHDLTRRSLLRGARYEYVMTSSPDGRGIDVALMYSPFTFRLLGSRSVRVQPIKGMRPTRDVLYVNGIVMGGDTLHVVVAHFPSRRGGEAHSRPFRHAAAEVVCTVLDSIKQVQPHANIIVAGDFNDYSTSESLQMICSHDMTDVSRQATGSHGAKGTYRYQGQWGSLDHILVSKPLYDRLHHCFIADYPFLLVPDHKYGGVQPKRNYMGPRWVDGFSDHLPLVMRLNLNPKNQP